MTDKNTRPMDEFAARIQRLERHNIFDIGDVLLEAKAACEPGEWLDWLETKVEYSEDKAERCMNAARLADRFRNLRNLNLGKTVIYALAKYLDHPALQAMINALEAATTKGRVSVCDAQDLILLARLRHDHGDLPDAALWAINNEENRIRIGNTRPWQRDLIAQFRAEKPDTEEAVAQVEQQFHLARINPLYGDLLPRAMPVGELTGYLAHAPEETRQSVTEKLFALKHRAITPEDVTAAYGHADRQVSTTAPGLVSPPVKPVAKRVAARQRQRTLSAEKKEQNRRGRIRQEIDNFEDHESTDDLMARLRHLAAKHGYTRDDLLNDTMGNVEEFNFLAELYGWAPSAPLSTKVEAEAASMRKAS